MSDDDDDEDDDDALLGALHSPSWVPNIYSRGVSGKTNIAAGGVFGTLLIGLFPVFALVECTLSYIFCFPLRNALEVEVGEQYLKPPRSSVHEANPHIQFPPSEPHTHRLCTD